jgi:ATP-dependent DNA helicase RecQ
MSALATGRDVLAILPTGTGKSLPAQAVTATRCDHGLRTTLALSPLIALATDQNDRAKRLGLSSAMWHGKIKGSVKHEIIKLLDIDTLDVLFTTPESLGRKLGELSAGCFGLAWIDECHVAINARYYREHWARCGEIVDVVQPVVRYCCTATCRPFQQEEIIARCGLRDPLIVRVPPSRPELRYAHVHRDVDTVCEILQRHRGQRILVYVATRRLATELHAQLQSYGYDAGCYHGDMGGKTRAAVQDAFAKRNIDIVVATDAFGLGVDYADIRAVVLYDPASDVSAFVQQAGRAGRDGGEALIYVCSQEAESGWASRAYLVQSNFPTTERIRAVWAFLNSQSGPVRTAVAARACEIAYDEALSSIHWLKRKNLVLAERDPVDRRRELYCATGSFGDATWDDYRMEQAEAVAALDELRSMWRLPATEIPAAILAAFEGGH